MGPRSRGADASRAGAPQQSASARSASATAEPAPPVAQPLDERPGGGAGSPAGAPAPPPSPSPGPGVAAAPARVHPSPRPVPSPLPVPSARVTGASAAAVRRRGGPRARTQERLHEVVVAVDQRDVDLLPRGDVARAVQQEALGGRLLVEPGRRREGAQDPERVRAVRVPGRLADQRGELEERGGQDRRGGGVVGRPRHVEIPARDAARREPRQEEVRGATRRLEHAGVPGVPVDHREPVDGPRLAARPGRAVGRALERAAPAQRAGARLVVRHVERAAVGADEVRPRSQRVAERQLGPRRIAPVPRGPEQQLEVHHRVDDDREPPVGVPVAAVDGAHLGAEARRERGGAGEEDVPVGRVAGEPVGVAEARDELEADVVRLRVRLLGLERGGEALRALAPGGIAAPLVEVPEHPGEEPLGPTDAVRRRHGPPEAVRSRALRQAIGGEARRRGRALRLRHGERPLRRRCLERRRAGVRSQRRERDGDARVPDSRADVHGRASPVKIGGGPPGREPAHVGSPRRAADPRTG